jgi:hypothetical protein
MRPTKVFTWTIALRDMSARISVSSARSPGASSAASTDAAGYWPSCRSTGPMDRVRVGEVARVLATGTGPTTIRQRAELETLRLPLRVGIADEERELLELYPQPCGREAAVEYVPAVPARRRDGVRSQPRR